MAAGEDAADQPPRRSRRRAGPAHVGLHLAARAALLIAALAALANVLSQSTPAPPPAEEPRRPAPARAGLGLSARVALLVAVLVALVMVFPRSTPVQPLIWSLRAEAIDTSVSDDLQAWIHASDQPNRSMSFSAGLVSESEPEGAAPGWLLVALSKTEYESGLRGLRASSEGVPCATTWTQEARCTVSDHPTAVQIALRIDWGTTCPDGFMEDYPSCAMTGVEITGLPRPLVAQGSSTTTMQVPRWVGPGTANIRMNGIPEGSEYVGGPVPVYWSGDGANFNLADPVDAGIFTATNPAAVDLREGRLILSGLLAGAAAPVAIGLSRAAQAMFETRSAARRAKTRPTSLSS